MPFTPAQFLLGVVLPALAAALVLLAARRAAGGPGLGAALAVGGGYVLAHLLQRGGRGLPPREATDWAWVAAIAGMLAGASGLTRRRTPLLPLALRLLLSGALLWQLLAAWRTQAEPDEMRSVIAVGAAVLALLWTVVEVGLERPGWFAPALLAVTAAGAAGAIGLSGSFRVALLAGALCAVLCAAAVGSALRLAPPTLEGAAAPAVLALGALLTCAAFYSELPRAAAFLIGGAPVAGLVGDALLGARARRPAVRGGLLLLVAALLGLAVKLAVDASPSFDM
ncbi:MAG TPA: hypothetical protein VFY71_15440 [Planctomycetota bacterium]|nr:hypothetical protein [Planctomycetota bacterium]